MRMFTYILNHTNIRVYLLTMSYELVSELNIKNIIFLLIFAKKT